MIFVDKFAKKKQKKVQIYLDNSYKLHTFASLFKKAVRL